MKKALIVVMSIIILTLIGLGIVSVTNSLKKDKEKTKVQKEEINVHYEEFNKYADSFNEIKDKYEEIIENIYYSTVEEEREKLLTTIKNYDDALTNLKKETEELDKRCTIYYENKDTTQKCKSYRVSFEKAKEVFKKDIALYNKLVEEYNKWTKEKNRPQSLEKYVSNILE